MARNGRRDLPKGITPKLRTQGTGRVPVTTPDGTPVHRVRLWDSVLKRQIERTAEGLDTAEKLLAEFNEAKRRPGRLQAERVRLADVAPQYLVAYRVKPDGTACPKSSLAKERTCLNVYILPALGNAWMGDLDLPELNATIRHLTLQDGSPAPAVPRARSRWCYGGCSAGHARSGLSRPTPRLNCALGGADRCGGG